MSDCQSFINVPGAAWFIFYTLKPPIYQISIFLIFSYSVVPSFSKSQDLTNSTSSFFFVIVHELLSLVDLVIYKITIIYPPSFLASLAHFG